MINAIIDFSIKNKLVVAIATIGMALAGLWSMTKVPLDAVPDITNNQVQVITSAPNLSTQDIEQFITYPVELSMSNLPGVVEVRSISRFGLSLVTIVFEDDMGTYLPRQLVSEKLVSVKEELPQQGRDIEIGPISTGLGEIYQYTLEVDEEYREQYSLTELRTIQDWLIERQMAMVPGVVEINAFGGHIRQYEIKVNPHQLKSFGITLDEIQEALESNNENTGGAYIVKDHFANFIRGDGMVRSLEDIKNILVRTENGIPIYMKDVADVEEGKAIRYGATTKNGKGEAVGGTVMMLKDANSNETIRAVKKRMKEIEKTLPEGVHISSYLDRSELISNTTKTVSSNLMEGGLIVIFILVILLGNWRGGLIVASTIPLSLLFAFILMNVFDVWANLMSLGAIDFGIIVDGAVIIVESTAFLIYSKAQKTKEEMASQASKGMMKSAFFGQVIILIVFIPILFLEGIEGKMFKPMALTFMFAMMGATLLCLTYVPMMASWFMNTRKTRISKIGDRIVAFTERIYQSALIKVLSNPKPFVLSGVFMLALAAGAFIKMGAEFMPKLDEGNIAFHIMMKPGSALKEGIETATEIEKLLMQRFPEIKQIVSRFGVSDVPTDPMPMDVADSFIILKPRSEWTSASSKEELIEKIEETISVFPGVQFEFSQPIEMRFNELITGVREDVAIKLFGEDLDVLSKKAKEIEGLVKSIPGIGDVKAEATSGLPQINIQYQRAKLGQYGLHVADLNELIQTAFAGSKSGVVYDGEKRIDLVLRLHQDNRTHISDVQNIFITTPDGSTIPLKEVAHISYTPGPMQISRDNTRRRVYVGINVRGKDIKSVVEAVQQKLDEELELPPGYELAYGGAFENLQRATSRLKLVVPVALLLIFLLIFFALKSIKQTLMIYLAIPFAAVGGVYVLWLRDMPFSISAGIGFVVLFGVAVLNGLVLINGLNELKNEDDLSMQDIILKGSKRRVRPIMLTALTDILGFLPMALSTTAGAEVQRPLATVVIGGLITSTLLTLFLLPLIYKHLEQRKSLKIKPLAVTLLLLFGLGFSAQAQEQKTITTLEEALAFGLHRNGYVNIAEDYVEIREQQKKTSFNPEKLNLDVQFGQMNSEEQDLMLSIDQQFAFPTLYTRQSKLYEAHLNSSKAQLQVTENEIRKQIRESWFRLAYLNELYKLLTYQDSLFTRLLEAQTIRYQAEAATYLEYTSAETLVLELKNDLKVVEADMAIERVQLRILLSDTSHMSFEPQRLEIYSIDFSDTLAELSNPNLQYFLNQINVAQQEQKVASAEALPDIKVGYFAQSMNTFPLVNGDISGNELSFQGVQAGITIPLFFGSYNAKVKTAKIQQNIAQTEAAYYRIQLEGEFSKQLKEWEKYLNSLNYYDQYGLPQSERIIQAAKVAYKNGAIGYYEFILNMAQAIELKYKYLEYLDGHNQTLIELAYLIGL